MSTRTSSERILDILETIAEIQQFVAGMTFDQFQEDPKTLKAVMADFAIIGEAAGHIPDELTRQYPTIPWVIMRAMRNRMVHVYCCLFTNPVGYHSQRSTSTRRTTSTIVVGN